MDSNPCAGEQRERCYLSGQVLDTMCTSHPDLVSLDFYAIPILHNRIFHLLVGNCTRKESLEMKLHFFYFSSVSLYSLIVSNRILQGTPEATGPQEV